MSGVLGYHGLVPEHRCCLPSMYTHLSWTRMMGAKLMVGVTVASGHRASLGLTVLADGTGGQQCCVLGDLHGWQEALLCGSRGSGTGCRSSAQALLCPGSTHARSTLSLRQLPAHCHPPAPLPVLSCSAKRHPATPLPLVFIGIKAFNLNYIQNGEVWFHNRQLKMVT